MKDYHDFYSIVVFLLLAMFKSFWNESKINNNGKWYYWAQIVESERLCSFMFYPSDFIKVVLLCFIMPLLVPYAYVST